MKYVDFFRYEALDRSIRLLTDDVIDYISRTWNASGPDQTICFSIRDQADTPQALRPSESLRDVLRAHRPWWQTEQDFGQIHI